MKKILISLILITSALSSFAQQGSQALSGVFYRVTDTLTYQSQAATRHAQDYHDIYWNEQATTPHWDIWNGSSYDHIFGFGSGGGDNPISFINNWVPATGSGSYAATIDDFLTYDNSIIYLKFENTNAAAGSVNVNFIGSVAIRKWDGSDWVVLAGGEIDPNTIYKLSYSGAYYELESFSGPSSSGDIEVGTTNITGGSYGNVIYNDSGVVGEYETTGTEDVVRANTPTISTPNIDAINGASGLVIKTSSSNKWSFMNAGAFQPFVGNLYDIGLYNSSTAELTGANGVWVDGNYTYVATFTGDAVEIIDTSNPNLPFHVAKITDGQGGALLNGPIGCHKVGNYLYVTANQSNAVSVIDVTDPTTPVFVSSISNGGGGGAGAALSLPWNMDIVGNYLYVVSSSNAIEIIDITNPLALTHVGKLVDATNLNLPVGIEVANNTAFICSLSGDTFTAVDVTTPSSPTYISKLTNGVGGAVIDGCHGVWIVGTTAYVASRLSGTLTIVDVSNTASMSILSTLTDGTGGAELTAAENLQVVGNYAYIACYDNGDAFEIVDISNPAAPVHAGKLLNGAGVAPYLDGANRVYVSGNYAMIASATSNALEIVNITSTSSPAHAAAVLDAAGSTTDFRPRTIYAATSVNTPVVSGGIGVTDDLILQPTSGVGTTGADIIFKAGNNGATDNGRILNSGELILGASALIATEKFSIQGTSNATLVTNIRQNSAGTAAIQGYRSTNNSGTVLTTGMIGSGVTLGGVFDAGYAFNSTDAAGYNIINANASGEITFATGGTASGNKRWRVTSAGHLIGVTDNTFDIGASGATRPRTGYFGTSVISPVFTAATSVTSAQYIASNKGINVTAGDAATINGAAGRFRKDTSGSTFTLTNSLITANSIIVMTYASDVSATGNQISVVAGSGSAVITFWTVGVGAAAPTSDTDINFVVMN